MSNSIDVYSQKQVIEAIVLGFQKGKSKRLQAISILDDLFKHFSFDLKKFCKKQRLSQAEIDLFITHFLYSIYYERLLVAFIQNPEYLENQCLVFLAEVLPEKRLKEILTLLTTKQTLRLISHCSFNRQEGDWYILHGLENHPIAEGIRTHYYNASLLKELVVENKSPSEIRLALENRAYSEVKEIQRLLPAIMSLLKIPYQKLEIPDSFFRIFGLEGQVFDIPRGSLVDILKMLYEILQQPHLIPQPYVRMSYNLIINLYQSLQAYIYQPSKYAEGFEKLIFAIPTRGKKLISSPWLLSLLDGMEKMIHYLSQNGLSKELHQFPLLIFDQGCASEFKKNQHYLQRLAKQYRASIWHFSKDQMLLLAERAKVKAWIVSDVSQEYFGYAGSRNVIFLLAPAIQKAIKKGAKTFEELMQISFDFKEEGTLLISEDDMPIPTANLFSFSLFAEQHATQYFQLRTRFIGRDTWSFNSDMNFSTIIRDPKKVFPKWTQNGAMGLTLSKPRLCFPTQLPSEEWSMASGYFYDYFQQPQTHLGGSRFPKQLFPTSPYDGLVEMLATCFPYNMMFRMIETFLDQNNQRGRCIFPWSDPLKQNQFQCLEELLSYVRTTAVIEELKFRFWRNMEDFFLKKEDFPLRKDLANMQVPIDTPENLKGIFQKLQTDAQSFIYFGMRATQYHQQHEKDFIQKSVKETEQYYQLNLKQLPLTHILLQLIQAILK